MFSKTCEYAIKASIYIASQSMLQKRVGIKDIAQAIESPEAFTGKIMQVLSKYRIVDSVKGPHGGFEISSASLKEKKLAELVRAIDGDNIFKSCGLGLKECSGANPCPLHNQFARIRADITKLLENTTLYDVAAGLSEGLTFLKR